MERLWPRLAVPARPVLAAPSRLAAPARLAAGLAGLAAAAGALALAEGPGRSTTYPGRSATGAALTLCAGLAGAALEELRELAHGIYPAILAEAGVAPALATLADTAPLPVQILQADDRRYPAPLEAAAYFTVAEAIDDAARRGAELAVVSVARKGRRLIVTVEDNSTARDSPMVTLSDRVGALGGNLFIKETACRAEIPCALS